MRKAIATGFAVTDQEALAQAQQHHWLDGAVCVAVWIVQDTVFVANVGLMMNPPHQNWPVNSAPAVLDVTMLTFFAAKFLSCLIMALTDITHSVANLFAVLPSSF